MSETNDITTLRNHLFDTIEGIKNKSITIEQAKAISGVGQTVINSAKIEIEYMKLTGAAVPPSGFIPLSSTPKLSGKETTVRKQQ